MPNLFADIPALLTREMTNSLIQAKQVRIERIVSQGQASPPDFWYDQDESEFVLLIQGAACLQFEDELLELQIGDWVNIPAHRKHRVMWSAANQQTIWLTVFYRP